MPSFQLTHFVLRLLLINVAVFVLQSLLVSQEAFIYNTFALHQVLSPLFKPWQFISHFFMHGNLMHIFSNMLGLIVYGPFLENRMGGKRFLTYYMITGLGAAVLHSAITFWSIAPLEKRYISFKENPTPENYLYYVQKVNRPTDYFSYTVGDKTLDYEEFALDWEKNKFDQHFLNLADQGIERHFTMMRDVPMVGASGAIFGLMLAFGILFAEVPLIMIFFPIPIKAKYMVLIHGGMELYRSFVNDPGDPVAHFAHLGGMLFGFLLLRYWKFRNNQII